MSPEQRALILRRTSAEMHRSRRLADASGRLCAVAAAARRESAHVRRQLFVLHVGGAADGDVAGESIKEKLATGLLPRRAVQKTFYGPGVGKPCVACGRTITSQHIEVEADFDGGPTLRFHSACFDAWRCACA
jgi:hypothetical protein